MAVTEDQVLKDVIKVDSRFIYDVIVVGGGIAGISAAIMLHNRGVNSLLIEEAVACSNLYNVPIIEDCSFIVGQHTNGNDLSSIISRQAANEKINICYERVTSIGDLGPNKKSVTTDQHIYHSKTVIIATGSSNKEYEIQNSNDYYGRGLSFCAPCDIVYYMNKDVALFGKGENAAKTAVYISQFVNKVYMISEFVSIRASEYITKQLYQDKKIEMLMNHSIVGFDGENSLEALLLTNLESNKTFDILVSGLFIYDSIVGNLDALGDLKNSIKCSEENFICTENTMETNIKGIYAIGSIRDQYPKRVVIAVSDAITAVNEIQKQLYFTK